jgi:hypothetical protein
MTPSDFYLFGHMRQVMVGQPFSSAEGLLLGILVILDDLEKAILIAVFRQ